ncbi:Calcineurin B ous protein 1 [Amphibalanus amphitrite]|uniref:Calcineurin B ous protein 1 n=1 Tax=Amphibalanus amphitrite TaxID=1232801 RepID=A0A6A4WSH7_AMPAM|nr:calcineurin B homologous protein 1-like [Amphibalanus amphitrite]KAF0310157.1 Calcineurin B ous protein 1 [Amphibalanus amphitrite]
MGNSNSVTLQPEEVERMQNETGFSASQIERLYSRFTTLDKFGNGALSREDLLRIPELAINPLGDRIVHAFFRDAEDESINFLQFLKTLAIFRPIRKGREPRYNSREQKLQFAFRMYDLDGDELISRDELLCVLHMMVGANISDEQLASIADRTIREVDQDNDDAISLAEFSEALKRTEVEGKMSIRYLN